MYEYNITHSESWHWIRVTGQLHFPGTLLAWKMCRYAFSRRPGAPYSVFGRFGEEKTLVPLPGIELRFLVCLGRSLVTLTTEISRRPFYVEISCFLLDIVSQLAASCKQFCPACLPHFFISIFLSFLQLRTNIWTFHQKINPRPFQRTRITRPSPRAGKI